MTGILIGFLIVAVIVLGLLVLILALGRGDLMWQRDEARDALHKKAGQLKDARQARDEMERDYLHVAREMSRLLGAQGDDTVRLPGSRWHEFLKPPADDVDAGLTALENYANEEGR